MKFPEMRKELLGYLKDLSNWDYQKECWVMGNCPAGVEHDELDYSIHFLFDDTALSDEPESLIGAFLKNKEEAVLISNLCEKLSFIFDKYGMNLSDKYYIEQAEWKDVIDAAKIAYSKLS